jgi:glycosyltransferase involved in cell wall biosynthesis
MLLSLCIPAYNAEKHLARLLSSVNAQTQPFDEVLVYDDASTDRTAAIAAEYGSRVVSGRTNVGCSRGRNILAREARGEWIHFHDADDAMAPDFVAMARE